MDDILAMQAKSVLRDVKPSLWDSVGVRMYTLMTAPIEGNEDHKLVIWKATIDQEHKSWTSKYRQYVKANGIYADFSKEEEKRHDENHYASDIGSWDMIKIKRIERMGDILKFFTDSGDVFDMDVGDIYSQTEFRKSVTKGATIILPAIEKKSFERFILSLSIVKVEDIGVSLIEKVEEAIENQKKRLKDASLPSEEAAIEAVESRGIAMFNNCIYFKLQSILSDMWKDSHSVSTAKLVSAVRDLGAENIKHRKFNFWKYDLGENTTK